MTTNNMEKMAELLKKIDKEYNKLVEEAAENDKNLIIPNSSVAHAILISQKLIDKAENNIKILTGELTSVYYDHISDNLGNATRKLSRLGAIRIIISDAAARENPTLNNFLRDNNNVIQVKRVNEQVDRIDPESFRNHFLVSDSKRYRFEKPHTREDLDEFKVEALANFGDEERAEVLDSFFDKIWDSITEA